MLSLAFLSSPPRIRRDPCCYEPNASDVAGSSLLGRGGDCSCAYLASPLRSREDAAVLGVSAHHTRGKARERGRTKHACPPLQLVKKKQQVALY